MPYNSDTLPHRSVDEIVVLVRTPQQLRVADERFRIVKRRTAADFLRYEQNALSEFRCQLIEEIHAGNQAVFRMRFEWTSRP